MLFLFPRRASKKRGKKEECLISFFSFWSHPWPQRKKNYLCSENLEEKNDFFPPWTLRILNLGGLFFPDTLFLQLTFFYLPLKREKKAYVPIFNKKEWEKKKPCLLAAPPQFCQGWEFFKGRAHHLWGKKGAPSYLKPLSCLFFLGSFFFPLSVILIIILPGFTLLTFFERGKNYEPK